MKKKRAAREGEGKVDDPGEAPDVLKRTRGIKFKAPEELG